MKIGFDVSQTGKFKTGCGYYAYGLIDALSQLTLNHKFDLYSCFGDSFWDEDYLDCFKKSNGSFQTKVSGATFAKSKLFWQMPASLIETQLSAPDVVHSNNYFCPSQKLPHTKLVYTLYDLSFLENPEWTTEANRITCFNGVFTASLHADYLIAISQYSKDHFLRVFPHFPENKIEVLYAGSRFKFDEMLKKPTRFTQLKQNQFWLSVGTLEPRKNQVRLLEAYSQLTKEKQRHFPLVLAGGKGWLLDDLANLLKDLAIEEHVHLLGYVDDQELQWLYQNCFCFVYPSLFEGFGLPVLEAMGLKSAVITSKSSSIPEIVGDSAIVVNPHETNEILQAMRGVLSSSDRLIQLKEKAFFQAQKFCWMKSAQRMLEIYESI